MEPLGIWFLLTFVFGAHVIHAEKMKQTNKPQAPIVCEQKKGK